MAEQTPLQVLCDNLALLEERKRISAEQRDLAWDMLTEALLEQAPTDAPDALYHRFLAIAPFADGVARARFCMALCRQRARDPRLLPEELFGMNEQPAAGSHGKIAYVRNRYNERAFERFSEVVPNAKPEYVSGFSEACESVYDGRCSYCVLPVENDVDGRLFRFYAMADRYELKLCGVTDLEDEDSSGSVRYALAGRCTVRSIPRDRLCVLEFSLTREDGTRLSDLLLAAEALGATPHALDFLPMEYDHRLYRQYLSFRLPSEHAAALGLYLSLDYPNYAPIGFYPLS